MKTFLKFALFLLAYPAIAQVVGIQPTPLGIYNWDPVNNVWAKGTNSSTANPFPLVPQAYAFYGFNAATGQWTPCTTMEQCGLPSASGVTQIRPGNGISVSPSTGVGNVTVTNSWSINGDNTPTQNLNAGANITITDSGNGQHMISSSGGGGGGSILPGGWNDAGYTTQLTPTTTILGPVANVYTIPLSQTSSTINTFLASGAKGKFRIQYNDAHTPFDNSAHHYRGEDDRTDVPTYLYDVKEEGGAQCDGAQTSAGHLTAGVNETVGLACSASLIGKTIMVVGPDPSGNVTSFISTITGTAGDGNCQLASNSPITTPSGWEWTFGHDDYTSLSQSLAYAFSNGLTLSLPEGKCMTTQTLNFDGQSIWGRGGKSQILGPPGMDTFAAHDPSTGSGNAFAAGQTIRDFQIAVDSEIDATKPWNLCTDSAGCVAQTPLYRPVGVGSPNGNFPLNRGWITGAGVYNTGAIDGVANVTASSTVICIPSTETLPSVGQQIIFPYQGLGNPAFSTTVSSTAGSCGTGFSPITLAAAWTGATITGPQYVNAQAWFAGTSIQTTASAIPSSASRVAGSVTAYSISGNVITVTVANGFVSGQAINLYGFPTSTFLNNKTLTISTVSGTQFTAPFIHANASATEAGQALPFPFQLLLTNDITPDPQWAQANVAPWGLIELADTGEICSYFRSSNIPAQAPGSPQWINITACAQNGSTAASHASGTQVFPLNPLNPAMAWAIVPSLNTTTMPTGAEPYPALGVGNAAIALPTANGIGSLGNEAPFQALWENIKFVTAPIAVPSFQNPANYQVQNDTAAIYTVPIPFKSTFRHIQIQDTYYGIAEGMPGINISAGQSDAYTGDGNKWEDIQDQSSAFDQILINEGSSSWTDVQNFSQSFTPPNNVWPGYPIGAAGSGALGDLYMDGYYSDISAPGCCTGSHSGLVHTNFNTHYVEMEGGAGTIYAQWFTAPAEVLSCGNCNYVNWEPKDGGDPVPTYVGGVDQQFIGGNSGASDPWLNFGAYNSYLNVAGLAQNANSAVYGVGGFLNWGPGTQMTGSSQSSMAPFLPNTLGNTRELCMGQTQEMFFNGNLTTPYACAGYGLITPDEFNSSSLFDVFPMTRSWTLDPTEPITGSYAACTITPTGGCATFQWDGGSGIYIGPGQRIQAGKYLMFTDFNTPAGANSFTYKLSAGSNGRVSCGASGAVYTATVTTTGSGWSNYGPFLVDFTGKSGCVLYASYSTSSTTASVETGFIDFLPLPQTYTTQNVNVLNQVQLGGSPGTAGQCPISGGSGSPTVWGTCGSGGTGPGAANQIAIYTGTNTIGGDANLTDTVQGGMDTLAYVDPSSVVVSGIVADVIVGYTSLITELGSVTPYVRSLPAPLGDLAPGGYLNYASKSTSTSFDIINNVRGAAGGGSGLFSFYITDPTAGTLGTPTATISNTLSLFSEPLEANTLKADNLTLGFIPIAGSASLSNSLIDEGITNANAATISDTGGVFITGQETVGAALTLSSLSDGCLETVSNVVTSTGSACGSGGGSGTVTSVSFTGGLISVATPTTTPAFTIAGTNGGIPYFDTSSHWSSSAQLPSGDFVLGGGPGGAPAATFSVVPVVNGGTATGSTLTGLVRGGNPFTSSELSGDATTSGSNAVTVVKINGTTVPSGPVTNQVLQTNATSTGVWKTLPSCSGTGNGLTYNNSSQTWGCGSFVTSSTLTSGFLASATGASVLGNSGVDEGVTTPNVLSVHDTGGIALLGSGPGIASPTTTTVGSLPSASSLPAGSYIVVSDANSFTVGTCTGGGSDYMIAITNGSTWSCH